MLIGSTIAPIFNTFALRNAAPLEHIARVTGNNTAELPG